MKKALLSVLVYFLISQIGTGVCTVVIAMALGMSPKGGIPVSIMMPCMIVSCAIAILVCWKGLKVMRIPETFSIANIKWGWALTAIVATFFGIFAGNLATEMADLPNMIEDMMLDSAKSIWGFLAIGILCPIAEELLFREGVCGYLARNGARPWKAIWVSAILFGLIHVNPAQVPFAMLLGVMLGMIYIKTGSVVVPSIIHILNNSFAMVTIWIYGEEALDESMVEWVGGNIPAGICIIVGFALCFFLLRKFWEQPTPSPSQREGEWGEKN